MSKRSFHCKSLELGYYPTLSQMIRSSGFSIFKQKNKWKNIMDSTYSKLFLLSFSFFFSADFSNHSFLKNAWGRFVYEKNQGAECHGNNRIELLQMKDIYPRYVDPPQGKRLVLLRFVTNPYLPFVFA